MRQPFAHRLSGFTLLAAFAITAGPAALAEPAKPRPLYVIPDNEGYGVVECMLEGRDCGKAVADSWCEAHGHAAALAYGRAEDITASIGAASPQPAAASGSAVVACKD